jgi:hypothetical protein
VHETLGDALDRFTKQNQRLKETQPQNTSKLMSNVYLTLSNYAMPDIPR